MIMSLKNEKLTGKVVERKRVYVYIDAENLSLKKLEDCMSEINDLRDKFTVVAKFYGATSALKGHFPICIRAGIEYVPTDVFVSSCKKVADMKIVVDVMQEVLMEKPERLHSVYLASEDSDFVPLIHKLMGLGVKVNTPFLNPGAIEESAFNIESALRNRHYEPQFRKDFVSVSQYCVIRDMLPEVDDAKLDQFFRKKKLNFARSMVREGFKISIDELMQIDNDFFTPIGIVRFLGIQNSEEVFHLLRIFTRKMFGFTYPSADAKEKVAEILA